MKSTGAKKFFAECGARLSNRCPKGAAQITTLHPTSAKNAGTALACHDEAVTSPLMPQERTIPTQTSYLIDIAKV
jgi:hypothetical protein